MSSLRVSHLDNLIFGHGKENGERYERKKWKIVDRFNFEVTLQFAGEVYGGRWDLWHESTAGAVGVGPMVSIVATQLAALGRPASVSAPTR